MVFVGRCEPRKGLHYALEAWHRAGVPAHGRFVICGAYVPGYREVLARWLDGASVEERGLRRQGQCEMRNADVLVLPSIERVVPSSLTRRALRVACCSSPRRPAQSCGTGSTGSYIAWETSAS